MELKQRPRGLAILLAGCACVLVIDGLTQAFVPPAHRVQPRLENPAATLPTSAAAVAAGLVPLALAPEASVAQGWEMAVIGPLGLINTGLNLFKTALGIYALMSWLYAFGIIDLRNEIVQKVQGVLSSIIDPVLSPLWSIIPPLGGFDISFMVLWFVIEQAQAAAVTIMFGAATYGNYYY
mmetsp:Transcript_62846/g.99632  ORF Transcript_62846/g.99632 Transcript_62846/m.99632 type:complete len:180 (-) Transcript_62846:141-680(-)